MKKRFCFNIKTSFFSERKDETLRNRLNNAIDSINDETKLHIFKHFIQLQKRNNKKTIWKSNAVLMLNILLVLNSMIINFNFHNYFSEWFLIVTIFFVITITYQVVFTKYRLMEAAQNLFLKTFHELQRKISNKEISIEEAFYTVIADFENKQTTVTKKLFNDKNIETEQGILFYNFCKKIEKDFFDIIDKHTEKK